MKHILFILIVLSSEYSCSRLSHEKQNSLKDTTVLETKSEESFQYLISNGRLGDISVGDNIDLTFSRLNKEFDINKDSIPTCEGCEEYTRIFIVSKKDNSYPLFEIEPGYNESNKDKVFRITTSSNKFKTDKNIKVGMTIKEIKERYEIIDVDSGGETGLHILLKDFEGSFGIEIPNDENWWIYKKETIPDSLRIIEIIIT